MQRTHSARLLAALAALVTVTSCASYTVPGRAADLGVFTGGQELDTQGNPVDERSVDEIGLAEILDRRPTAAFPAGIAVARVQAPDYRSHTIHATHGRGAYTVVVDRDVESDETFERLGELPQVVGVAPVNRLLLPSELRSDLELRKVAARLHADLLLVYTIDTVFEIDDAIEPLGVITLGLLHTEKAHIRSTASAVLLDTRTAYVYAVAEKTASHETPSRLWTTAREADQARRETEQQAFDGLVEEFADAWSGVVLNYAAEPGR